ncbi:T9SS type A sorting domain-containing protein [Persicitalea jodogahamensis]|nr:T9SS type A sorting domain-containing protein [Persicitalea jodogahamensis]
MNNTSRVHYYRTPNNTIDSLNPQRWDFWIDKVRFLAGTPRVSTLPVQLSDISFRFQGGVGIIRLSDFLIQDIEGVNPVNLTYFNADPINSQVELNWETAWEQNSREFIVQRSNDLKEFGDVGRVAAAGESDGRRQYAFTDFTPPPGNNYYRLRMVDKDNTYEYSNVKDVIVRPGQPTLWVAANPTSGERIRVRSSGVDAAALRLTTIMGQDVSFRLNQNSDGYTELIPAVRLAPGMYFLSLDQDGLRKHTKVLVH